MYHPASLRGAFVCDQWEVFRHFEPKFTKHLEKATDHFGAETRQRLQSFTAEAKAGLGLSGDFELRLVIDSDMVIAGAFACCRREQSFLMRLVQGPLIKLSAPRDRELVG